LEKFNKFNGWIIKNKWGSFVPSTLSETRSAAIKKVNWKTWKRIGHKVVRVTVRLKEV